MTEYDLAQRERIRETLLSYMKEHKVGVPRLAARIKEAVHRNPEIPVKTLQRFMKGEVRTIDMHVGFLGQFVEKISKEDPTLRLGFALSAFYSYQDKTDWTGTFVAEELDPPGIGLAETIRSKIEIVRDQGTWRVRESPISQRRVYDGAMTSSGNTVVIVLRDRLHGLPRTITVCAKGKGHFEGVATAAYFPRSLTPAMSPFRAATRTAQIALRR
jgi:hypothetical protein